MPKICYYQVLGVDSDAGGEALKKAYRKCALRWHPDKNIDDETAHANFLAVQEAYTILSDPHERAWYDKHKDQILCDDSTSFEYLNVYAYFSTSCFNKEDIDGENGFFAVYRRVFENISEENEAVVGKGNYDAPSFGFSNSPYPEIVELFYAFWGQFTTTITFAWTDEKISRDFGRKAIKFIERENQKRREKLRKERNEEVRNLVSFIRKRDPRVKLWKDKVEQEKREKFEKVEELRRDQLLKKKQLNEGYQESEWTKFSTLENELQNIEENIVNDFSDNSSESENNYSSNENVDEAQNEKITSFYCVACRKMFQSEKAFQNHEGSKKHKQNIAAMKN